MAKRNAGQIALSKVRHEAKRIMQAHGGSYKAALKRAGKAYREGALGKSAKTKSHKPKKKAAAKKHHAPAAHHSRHHAGHRVTGLTQGELRAAYRSTLERELGYKEACILKATKKTDKNKYRKDAAAIRKKLKAVL